MQSTKAFCLSLCATVATTAAPSPSFAASDPWEGLNRRVHAFNRSAQTMLLNPLARLYVSATPAEVRRGVANALGNVIFGNAAADIFLFGATPDAADRIMDYAVLDDGLSFSAGGFGGGLVAGMDVAAGNVLVLGATATEAHGQFLYDHANGRLTWDADGNGAGAAVMVALLSGLPDLNAAGLQITT